jgi:4-hydroxybenzoate polyprenyltransferase
MAILSTNMKKYLSLVKFSHTIFALPFAMIGAGLGFYEVGQLDAIRLLLILGCMVTARSAAMGFNRLVDRKFDAQNPRTALREIPSGGIGPQQAAIFVALNGLLFIGLTYGINPLCFYLSPVALAVILGYSYTKRYTALCHFVLGLGLSLAPVGAYLAVTGSFKWPVIILGLAVLAWVSGFDIIYSLQDRDFDQAHDLYSVPVMLGQAGALNLSRCLHVAAFGLLILFGILLHLSIIYWLGVSAFGFFLIYQHRLVRLGDLSRVNLAFFTSNGIASVCFGILTLLAIYWDWIFAKVSAV